MNDINIVSITGPSRLRAQEAKPRILLLKPPYFTPWTPPLGIAILKTFLEQHGYSVTCFDYNTDPELWGMHHKYFSAIQQLEDVSINDGYSKLWWILNAHLLAYANGADAAAIARVLEIVIPLYGIRHNHDVIDALIPIVDRYFKRLRAVTERIPNLWEYGVVGTSTYTTSLASSLFLLKGIKEKKPGISTVMGGGIFADDLALGSDNLDTLIAECSYIDHVVLGEGEMLFLKLLEGELSHKRVITIADLKGSSLNMKDVPPPDFSDLDLENYYHLSIEGARSCPFQCSFCSETIQWGDYRKKPMDQFAEQVVDLSNRFKIKEFFMGDSLMNPYINQFALELSERKAGVRYDGYLRADKPVTNRKFVKMWADSGLFRVRLGIESAASKVLNIMDKMTTPKVISDVLKTLSSAGIRTTTYWIVGFPGETEADFRETCDFIREHHRYIYELEAHPYYYYPYGQVGSRLYQCSSLYPEEVTNYTKFRVWEIDDANPAREVRYERLRRLAKMCSELGLINIYTMNERYQAEDRWHRLHPLAVDVYQSGRIDRKPAIASRVAIDAGPSFQNENSVIGYHASVTKQLNQETLVAALGELINYNEVLQLSVRDGKYSADDSVADPHTLLSVYRLDETDQESRAKARARAFKELSRDMRPARNASLRAALIAGDDPGVELLLLVHRAVADAKSVTLLFEDLFRIYEQLSHKRSISLRPIAKPAMAAIRKFDYPERVSFSGELNTKTAVVEVDQRRVDRMFSKTMKDDDIKAADVFVHAITAALAKAKQTLNLDVRIDSRILDDELRYTPGPLTRTCALNAVAPVDGQIRSALLETRQIIRSSLSGAQSNGTQATSRALLNLEFCDEKPWLGQDQWKPGGFACGSPLAARYQLEVTVVEAGRGLHVYVKYRDSAAVPARALINELVTEIDAVLEGCENYAAAREYWGQEFRSSFARMNFSTGADTRIARRETAAFSCELDRLALRKLSSECRVDLSIILLAVYTIVLARQTGSEDLALVTCPEEANEPGFVPLRINLPWESSFRDFAHQIDRKLGVAYQHGADAFEILSDGSQPCFDTGYIFSQEADMDRPAQKPQLPQSMADGLRLMFEVQSDCKGIGWRFNYDQSSFTPDAIERLDASFSSILARVAENIYTPLTHAVLDGNEKLMFESSITVAELESTFSF